MIRPTHRPIPTLTPTITPTLWRPIFYPDCMQGNKTQTCYDELLDIEFTIPVTWGKIEATLREGWDAGLAYFYTLHDYPSVQAGGRSADFAEGRGGFLTDFLGFSGTSKTERCRRFFESRICGDIQSDVYLYYLFPEGWAICDQSPGIIYEPLMLVAIDLPTNDQINGFVFVGQMLIGNTLAEYEQDLEALIGPYEGAEGFPTLQGCNEEGIAQFENQIQELVEAVQAREVDLHTKANIDAWFRLAQSIKVLD